jgi:6-phosphofructokinase
MPARNMVVAQSGGPSPVINNSLRGIIEQAREMASIGTVYGARHGIEGVLKEELLDLSAQTPEEVSLLRYTPAAGSIGTCRYKLLPKQTEDFNRVLEVFRAHDVGYFLYIGGNDSMDTANKVAQLAQERGMDLIACGVPKTIDNDVGDLGVSKDSFGHAQFGASEMAAQQALVNGRQRFARLKSVFAGKRLSSYTPQGHRK